MNEAKFQGEFTKWIRHHTEYKNSAFELKLTKNKSLPFSALQPHQKDALWAVKHGHLSYKIPDSATGHKPFDCFLLSNAGAYVVVRFFIPRKREFYIIDIDAWLKCKEESSRKSITKEMAEEIGVLCKLS